MRLHIIHEKSRTDRYDNLMNQLSWQGITDYELHDAVIMSDRRLAVATAHTNIVRANLDKERLVIAEDDVIFTKPDSWQKFLEWSSELPDNWDIYTSGYYCTPKIVEATENLNRIRSPYNGIQLYMIRNKAYERFINVPPRKHVDINIFSSGLMSYAPKRLLTKQMGGFSIRQNRVMNYGHIEKKLTFY